MTGTVLVKATTATGSVLNLQRCCVHDGPGIRTTVFLKGCPLSCGWCHNPESRDPRLQLAHDPDRCIDCGACEAVCPLAGEGRALSREHCLVCGACAEACPAEARTLVGETWSVEDVVRTVEADRVFFDCSGGGVTFSGGEPTAQPGFLEACLEACRDRGLHTAVDTCGCAQTEVMERVGELADVVLYDLKLMDPERHQRHTGVGNSVILDNLGRLSAGAVDLRIRVPLVPGVNDDEENLHATGRHLASLPARHPVHVLPYHSMARGKLERLGDSGANRNYRSPTREEVVAAAELLRGHGLEVHVGG